MMTRTIYLLVILFFFSGCNLTGVKNGGDNTSHYREPNSYNFRFRGYTGDIDDPQNDRRCYYRIYIDKVDEGRTTTGLESQEKIFQSFLSVNRHLLRVEKWVLDKRAKKYVKLNNIDQPKPPYIYFTLPEGRIVTIDLRVTKSGSAKFSVSYERD